MLTKRTWSTFRHNQPSCCQSVSHGELPLPTLAEFRVHPGGHSWWKIGTIFVKVGLRSGRHIAVLVDPKVAYHTKTARCGGLFEPLRFHDDWLVLEAVFLGPGSGMRDCEKLCEPGA